MFELARDFRYCLSQNIIKRFCHFRGETRVTMIFECSLCHQSKLQHFKWKLHVSITNINVSLPTHSCTVQGQLSSNPAPYIWISIWPFSTLWRDERTCVPRNRLHTVNLVGERGSVLSNWSIYTGPSCNTHPFPLNTFRVKCYYLDL